MDDDEDEGGVPSHDPADGGIGRAAPSTVIAANTASSRMPSVDRNRRTILQISRFRASLHKATTPTKARACANQPQVFGLSAS